MTTGSMQALVLGIVSGTALATPPANRRFLGIGDLPGGASESRAFDVTYYDNGSLAAAGESVGANGMRAIRWTPSGGLQDLGVLEPGHTHSSAKSINWWGSPHICGASGTGPSPEETVGFNWWPSSGMSPLPADPSGRSPSVAYAFCDDVGFPHVGVAVTKTGSFPYRSNQVVASFGGVPEEGAMTDITWNGSHAVGYSRDTTGSIQACHWRNGALTGLGFLNATGVRESRAWCASYAFAVFVAGESTSPNGAVEAFRWSGTTGMVGLGDLPGGAFRSAALGMSRDVYGATIVGWSEAAGGERAFIWTESTGMRDLKSVLEADGFNLQGWTLLSATSVYTVQNLNPAPIRAIAGVGINPLGHIEGWVADYVGPCYADCTDNGLLTVADFGCFQSKHVLGDAYADCNSSGSLTVADFGCFQGQYVLGCP